jgi:AraC-like DNA-binding protein
MDDLDAHASSDTVFIQMGDRFPTLRRQGIAAERFPDYTNIQTRIYRVDVTLMTCIVSGCGTFQVGDRRYDVGPGRVGIILQGQHHHLITDRDGMDVINLYLDLKHHPLPVLPPPWDRTLWSLLPPHPGLIHEHNQHIEIRFNQPRQMAAPLEWLIREQQDALPAQAAMMQQLLSVFLVECCRTAQSDGWSPLIDRRPDDPPWLEATRAHLDSAYDQPISLPELAARAGVSAEHLCRRYRRYTGQSPIDYLTHRRLQAAMWMLRTRGASITDIALDCGFSELSFFNRKFKQACGQTPTQYRKLATPTDGV